MKDTTLKIVGIIFLLISILHLARLVFKVEVIVGGFTIPQWISVLSFIIALVLSLWCFKAAK